MTMRPEDVPQELVAPLVEAGESEETMRHLLAVVLPVAYEVLEQHPCKRPILGDAVEQWMRAHREADQDPLWQAMLADLIDDYREHARLGLELNEEIPR